VSPGARITRSVLLGADFFEEESNANDVPLGIGRDVVLDRVIVDKNARIGDGVRLVNEIGVDHADGDGYVIRSGIIIVPKGAAVMSGVTA
jgi:glucose-1-phosphate adenylyltransferase